MVALYAVTIFASAALLFLAQPMFARMVLPMLGGSPAVWNTAMVFYQAVLLAGYAYADFSTRALGVRKQALIHLVILAMPMAVLPFAIPLGWAPPTQDNPIPWLLGLMSIAVGLPFFAISTTSPVLQAWFSKSGHRRAADPYFLYIASNLGSMLALVSYPLWIEPRLRLADQTWDWMWAYWGFVALMAACAIRLWFSPAEAPPPPLAGIIRPGEGTSPPFERPPATKQKLSWILLAFVPSSLLLGVTSYLSSEIAVIPLMWIVPLALYLLSFIIAFARFRVLGPYTLSRTIPLLCAPLIMLFAMRASQPIALLVVLHLAVFFISALLCHTRLSDQRPAASHLTSFYLCLSVGGVLGGVFNALVAPVVFSTIVEYPLVLGLACWVAIRRSGENSTAKQRIWDLVWPALLAAVAVGALLGVQGSSLPSKPVVSALIFSLASLCCYFLSRRPLRFVLGAGAVLAAGEIYHGEQGSELYVQRSFFGVHRVTLDPTGDFHLLVHGKTLHGMQSLDDTRRHDPLTYYHRTGPIGEVLALYGDEKTKIGAVGLGAGTLAAYGKPGQDWTYFEIDPVVDRLAHDQRFFTFLYDAKVEVKVVLGDARLSLADEDDKTFNLLVLDAYSSDAIPMHLVTREAMKLYLGKLAPGGILAFHISNLHLDLEPVFANLARDTKLVSFTRDDTNVSQDQYDSGKSPSVWMVMARAPSDLAKLTRDPRWVSSRGDQRPTWTDDFSSLLSVFRWQ